MKARCYRRGHDHFRHYGGRGIEVCDRWRLSFQNFLADMGSRPGPEYSIDRIDNDGDYEPGNCRWALDAQQRVNQRRTLFVEWEGRRVLLLELSRRLGKNYQCVRGRLSLGWDLQRALFAPVRGYRKKSNCNVSTDNVVK